MARIGNKIN